MYQIIQNEKLVNDYNKFNFTVVSLIDFFSSTDTF